MMIEPSGVANASVIIGGIAFIAAILFWIIKAVAAHAIGAALWTGIKEGLGKKKKEKQDGS